MATLTPTLTLVSTDLHSDSLNLTVTDSLTVSAPASGIARLATSANPLGAGAGVLITEASATATTFVYVKHLGVLASNGTSSCHATNDFVVLTNADADTTFIKLQPGEFCFFPLLEFDGADSGTTDEPGGLKVEGGGVGRGGAAHVMIEYGYWTRG